MATRYEKADYSRIEDGILKLKRWGGNRYYSTNLYPLQTSTNH